MPTGSVTSIAASSAACGGRTIAPNWGGTRRAEYGTPRSLQQIWPPPALHARILESPLDRHELVHEDRSGGDCAGIVEEAEGVQASPQATRRLGSPGRPEPRSSRSARAAGCGSATLRTR